MKSKEKIQVEVHYPQTGEGVEKLKSIQAKVMIEILEKQLGEETVKEVFVYMKGRRSSGTIN